MNVGSVMLDVIYTHEPGILGISESKFTLTLLQRRMAQSHIVRDGLE